MATSSTCYTPVAPGSMSRLVLKTQRASPAATPVVSSQTYQIAQSLAQLVVVLSVPLLNQWMLVMELLTVVATDIIVIFTMVEAQVCLVPLLGVSPARRLLRARQPLSHQAHSVPVPFPVPQAISQTP